MERDTTSFRGSYLKNLCRYWRLQADQEKTPLRPANVGDMMLPSDFLHTFPSPSWTMPKLRERNGSFKTRNRFHRVTHADKPRSTPRGCPFSCMPVRPKKAFQQPNRRIFEGP